MEKKNKSNACFHKGNMLLNINAMRKLENSNQLISRVWSTRQCKIRSMFV